MQAGEILAGKYRLVQQLGEGGEGSVYLAIHMQTEMFRAIKEIPVAQGGDGDVSCHELYMMKSLQDRHLPEIIDVFRQETSTYLVMEHVRGTALNKKIRNGGILSVEEVLDTAVQVTQALCYLESRDSPICHLDIKPSNLILRPDGLIKLVDFGSAWKEKAKVRRMVTDGYAAPEQYRDDGTKPDTRTDIYSLGATLYRMISGKCYSAQAGLTVVPNCPQELSEIILRCLREDPGDRYQSAASLMDALEHMNRRKRWERGRVQILGALAMALPAAALCIQILPSAVNLSADESWNYEKLIQEAGVVGEAESHEYYRKAIFMEPENSKAYLCYLSDARMDGNLSDEEELFLRDTLHTVRLGAENTYEELLAENPEEYAGTAMQIGLAYWYDSVREDARRIALGWFEKAYEAASKAADAGKKPDTHPDNQEMKALMEEADIYLKLGTVMEKIHSPNEEEAGVSAVEYWEEIGILLDRIRDTEILSDPLTQLKFIREALSTLTFLSRDLNRADIGIEEQTRMIDDLVSLAEEVQVPFSQKQIGEQVQEEIRNARETAQETAGNLKRSQAAGVETESSSDQEQAAVEKEEDSSFEREQAAVEKEEDSSFEREQAAVEEEEDSSFEREQAAVEEEEDSIEREQAAVSEEDRFAYMQAENSEISME